MKFAKAIVAALAAVALAMGTVTASEAAGSTLTLGSIGKPTSLLSTQAAAGNGAWYYQATYAGFAFHFADGIRTYPCLKPVDNKTLSKN